MRLWALALPAAAFLLFLPTATANVCWEWLDVEAAVDEAHVEVAVGYVGRPASDLRNMVDTRFGDGDGTVTTSETNAFEDALSHDFEGPTSTCWAGLTFVRLADQPPVGIHAVDTAAHDLAGTGAASTQPLRLVFGMELDFDDESGAAVTATLRLSRVTELRNSVECAFPEVDAAPWGDHACGDSPTDVVSKLDHVSVRAFSGHRLDRDSVVPPEAARHWQQGGLESDTSSGTKDLMGNEIRVQVSESGTRAVSWPLVGAWVAGGGFAFGLVSLFASPNFRFLIFRRLAGMPGFSRITRDEALGHQRREAIVNAVRAQPGLSLADLQRRTEIPRGSLAYHIRVLERHRIVRTERHGLRTRFYPVGSAQREPYLTQVQETLLETIRHRPGKTQRELANDLGLPRKTVAYNSRRLQAFGMIEVRNEGVWRRHYPAEARDNDSA